MKTNGLIGWIAILVALIAASSTFANTVSAVRSPFSYGDAGEMTAYTLSDTFLSSYNPSTIVAGGFQTFSAQADLTFVYGTTYQLVLSQSDSSGHALTEGAAMLYYDFATGGLTGYDYNTADAYTRTQDSGELQSAIWDLQGYQMPGSQYFNGGAGNPFYDLALTDLGANLDAPNDGHYNVDIMQLWDNGSPAQALLTIPAGAVSDAADTCFMLAPVVAFLACGRAKKDNGPWPFRPR
jgi:hypothetical protein